MSPKAEESKAPERQVVFLIGPSHGAANGDKRSVSPDLAASLVERGLARYPANHGG